MIRRLALVLAFLFATTAALAQSYTPHGMSDGYLNMRAGPGTSHGIIKRLYPGDELTPMSKRGGWLQVRLLRTGEKGWVSQRFVKRVDVTNGPLMYVQPTSDGFLNLRKGPGTRYGIIYPMETGTEVRQIGRSGNWIKVRMLGGTVGWAHSRYLK
ncbi:SH3 domain-containing protein [uncultured Sulfitobacter sp.]|uniref:SH3 domain-containing protein n=1 Tax=uncultured Sulfitobacter sp. TaxID=191468 RepID=UPI002602F8E6|nr:SH3 domain-containing protein [uncultured Sulfitobacter sp.]